MQVLGYIKKIIFYIPVFFNAVVFIFKNIPEFIGSGGKSFHTPLDSTGGSIEGSNYFFRTIIQSDGDIINILPDVDVGMHEQYQEKYREHYDKVKQFCIELEGLSTITKVISTLLGFAVIFTLNNGLSSQLGLEMKIYLYAILWTIFSFFSHKFLSKRIFRLLIDLVVKYIKVKAF